MPPSTGALEIRGSATGLLDEPILLQARGAGGEDVVWRARVRDDDGRVWRASAASSEALATAWAPAKASSGPLPALQSLRPLRIDVRAELADGRAATKTLTRLFVADGVRIRRWRDGLVATLHLPAGAQPCAALLIDATGSPLQAAVAALAAPLLASRGVLALVVPPGRGGSAAGETLSAAEDLLAGVPGAAGLTPLRLAAREPLDAIAADEGSAGVALPPGIGAQGESESGATARAVAWDALLATLGAGPRETA